MTTKLYLTWMFASTTVARKILVVQVACYSQNKDLLFVVRFSAKLGDIPCYCNKSGFNHA